MLDVTPLDVLLDLGLPGGIHRHLGRHQGRHGHKLQVGVANQLSVEKQFKGAKLSRMTNLNLCPCVAISLFERDGLI